MTVDKAVEQYVKWVNEAIEAGEFTPAYCAGAVLCDWDDNNFRREVCLKHPDIPAKRMDHDRKMYAKRRADLTAFLDAQIASGKTRSEAADMAGISRQLVAYYVKPGYRRKHVDWPAIWEELRPQMPIRLDAIRVMYGLGCRAPRYQFDAGLVPSWVARRLEKLPGKGRPAWVVFDKEAEIETR